jgi:hypothetical protein
MEPLTNSVALHELNRIGFHLNEQFRPKVPAGMKGWGAGAGCG